MDNIVSERDFPIQKIWILKLFTGTPIFVIIFAALYLFSPDGSDYLTYLIIFLCFSSFSFIFNYLSLINFHFSLDKDFLTLKQGILSHEERHIPYGVIQNVIVNQSLFDRVLGLTSLRIENAAQAGGAYSQGGKAKILGIEVGKSNKKEFEAVGFSGNKVTIPGLKSEDALKLKELILQKMKENPIDDSQSGL